MSRGNRGGRPAKPPELHAIAGTFRADRHGGQVKPSAGRPTCPAWLDGAAKREWRRIVPELERLGLLTKVDRACLAGYCQAWAEFKLATELLQKEGRVVSGPIRPHPAVAMQRSAWAAIMQFAQRFGLDPADRVKADDAPQSENGAGKGRFFTA